MKENDEDVYIGILNVFSVGSLVKSMQDILLDEGNGKDKSGFSQVLACHGHSIAGAETTATRRGHPGSKPFKQKSGRLQEEGMAWEEDTDSDLHLTDDYLELAQVAREYSTNKTNEKRDKLSPQAHILTHRTISTVLTQSKT